MFFKIYIFSIAVLIVFSALNAIAHDAETLQYQGVRVNTVQDCNNLARTYEGTGKTVDTSSHPVYDPVNNNVIGYTCTVIVTVHNENHPSHTGNPSPQSIGGGGGDAVSGGGGAISGGGGSSVADDTSQDPELQVNQSQTPPQVAQAIAPPQVVALRTIRVTEYMVRDWSGISGRRLGVGGLPQWIELYNPSSTDLDITGYKFYYALYDWRSRTHKIHETPITVSITIPAKGAVIFATHATRKYGGIDSVGDKVKNTYFEFLHKGSSSKYSIQ